MLLFGSSVTAIRALRAEQKRVPAVGYLSPGSPGPLAPSVAAIRQGLSDSGYVEGQNLVIEYPWAEFHYDRFRGLAADLVSHKVNVIAACGGADEAFVAKDASSTIPTVFITGADPVETGLAASLARPGGNLTGVTNLTQLLWQKRVELIAELVPQSRVIGVLVNPNRALVGRVVDATQQAVNAKGLQIEILKASTEAEIDVEFATAVQRQIGAVVVSDPLFDSLAKQVAAAAARHAVPAIYISRKYVADGGLISYGAIFTAAYRVAGSYVGRILNGTNPADLPIQQSTNFELAVNLTTAKALGLTIPPAILARADEVIE
jgi:putative ABC transport system substrate-binding protein